MDTSNKKKSYWRMVDQIRASYQRKECLAASVGNCKGKIVKAHTVQENGSLSLMACEGHVYVVQAIYGSTDNKMEVRPVGIGLATTFWGFCADHDNKIFLPIEQTSYKSTPQQNFLFAYRSLCKEIYQREAFIENNEKMIAESQTQLQKETLTIYGKQARFALKELHELYSRMAKIVILDKGYRNLKHLIVEFKKVPTVACSGIFVPYHGPDDRWLDNDTDFNPLFVNVIPNARGGVAILSYFLDRHHGPEAFCNGLAELEDRRKSTALSLLALIHIDNHAINIHWWDGLTTDIKNKIMASIEDQANPKTPLKADWSRIENVVLDDWHVANTWHD